MSAASGRRFHLVLAACVVVAALPAAAQEKYDPAALGPRKAQFPEDAAALERGEVVYARYCAFCHGDEGTGDGGAAAYLDPRPRDFTLGLFKFRSTQTGELPTDEDLFRTISRGVPGTAMPAWGEPPFALAEADRWAVTYYLKIIATEDFADEDFNPYDYLLEMPEPPQVTPELIAKGKALYLDESKGGCVKCHGPVGRGDGREAGTHRDDWGDPILPADFTKAWQLRNGGSMRELFRSMSAGFNGTPMAGFAETFDADERWALVSYVRSLMDGPPVEGKVVLVAHKALVDIPRDPGDPFWEAQPVLEVPLAGQAVTPPRLASASVDLVRVRAAYTDEEVAFHFTWNDRFKDVLAPREEGGEPAVAPDLWTPKLAEPDTFITMEDLWARRSDNFRDRLQVQFPVRPSDGPDKPFFFLGGVGAPVHLWTWNADWNERPAAHGGRVAVERVGTGYKREPATQPQDSQALDGRGEYDAGRWRLVLVRPRRTGDPRRDTQFEPGRPIPFALQAWDGGNGEEGLLCAFSSWHYVVLEAEANPRAYAWAGAGTLLTLACMAGLVRAARRANVDELEGRFSTPATDGPPAESG